MFGDNEVIVNSSSNLQVKLHKRHNSLSFHHVHEAIASKFIDFNYLPSEEKLGDILSKHWVTGKLESCYFHCYTRNKLVFG